VVTSSPSYTCLPLAGPRRWHARPVPLVLAGVVVVVVAAPMELTREEFEARKRRNKRAGDANGNHAPEAKVAKKAAPAPAAKKPPPVYSRGFSWFEDESGQLPFAVRHPPTNRVLRFLRTSVELQKHQLRTALKFVTGHVDRREFSGLLISDDPGLGKTMTTLACLCALRASVTNYKFRVLIVAPKSVKAQWETEIRSKLKKPEDTLSSNWVSLDAMEPAAQYLVLSYGEVLSIFKNTFEYDKENKMWVRKVLPPDKLCHAIFRPHAFKAFVFDEVHTVRNPKSHGFAALQHLGCGVEAGDSANAQSPFLYPYIGLTGTPIVNGVRDLCTVASLLHMPESMCAAYTYTSMSREAIQTREAFQSLHFTRHEKDEIELPPLETNEVILDMNAAERQSFAKHAQELSSVLTRFVNDDGNKDGGAGPARTFAHVLQKLMRLRQSTLHPNLENVTISRALSKMTKLRVGEDDDEEDDTTSSDDDEYDDDSAKKPSAAPLAVTTTATFTTPGHLANTYTMSTKFQWLVQNVPRFVNEEKRSVLIFSSFKTTCEAIAILLKRHCKLDSGVFSGDLTASDREQLVKKFHKRRFPVMCITYGAGGVGLNLAPTATIVIHVDHWFTPVVHQQASDRAHRIGTVSPVREIYLMLRDSIDEYIIHVIQSRKYKEADVLRQMREHVRVRPERTNSRLNKQQLFKLAGWCETKLKQLHANQEDQGMEEGEIKEPVS